MLSAVLEGDGLAGIAELAAAEIGGPVAIVIPRHDLFETRPAGRWAADDRRALERWAAVTPAGTAGATPESVGLSRPIVAGGEEIGQVAAMRGGESDRSVDLEEVLRCAAIASLTELAVLEARDQLAEQLRGGLLEDLRAGGLVGREVVRRAKRLGCELDRGLVVIAARASGGKPRYMAAIITSTIDGAIAEVIDDDRVFALVGIGPGDNGDGPAVIVETLRRLRPHGAAAVSSHQRNPETAGEALAEAELMLEVIARDRRFAEQLGSGVPSGVYRLLFRALASNPAEVVRFYEDTVEPLVSHDHDHRTDLLLTLEAYLAHDCNMRATAEAVYAHRHTVAHRLTRIRELCRLDPSSGEDRERLGLGIKAYRLIEPTLGS